MRDYELLVAGNGAEEVPYNEPGYPVYAGSGWLHTFKDMGVINHWHWDIEFAYVLNGKVSYTINQETLTLRAGEGIVINSGQIHRNFSIDGEDGEYRCILLHPALFQTPFQNASKTLSSLIHCDSMPFIVLRPDTNWQNGLIADINSLYHAILSGVEANIFGILSRAFSIADTLMHNLHLPAANASRAHDIDAMRGMMGYIQLHYSEKILVSDISRAGKVGGSTCHALFRKLLGTSPMRYLQDYRMEKAAKLLTATEASVSDIAEMTGFASPSYFTECFREKYAATPTAYRNQKGM